MTVFLFNWPESVPTFLLFKSYGKYRRYSWRTRNQGQQPKRGLWLFDSLSILFGISIFAHERRSFFQIWSRLRGFLLFSPSVTSVWSSAQVLEKIAFAYLITTLYFWESAFFFMKDLNLYFFNCFRKCIQVILWFLGAVRLHEKS